MFAVVCFLAACGGGGGGGGSSITDPTPTPSPTPTPAPDPYAAAAGTYLLISFNGSVGLPASVTYTQPAPGGRLDVTSGAMVLRSDKSFTETIRFTNVPAGGAAVADSDLTTGTFTLSGTTIVFSIAGPYSWSGTLDASGNIAYNDQGYQNAFKK